LEAARVLFVGRVQTNTSSVVNTLKKHYRVIIAASGKQAISLAAKQPLQVVVLDAISMRTPGDRICHELRSALDDIPLIHLHPGPKEVIQNSADITLIQPISARKLTNAIERLLQPDDDETLVCGPFVYNQERRVLNVRGQETQLTPKQAMLVEMFFSNPYITLDRRTLMEKVWQTHYMGDTRTLDVHIRWLRELLEENPSKPKYLLTVRGVGYCLTLNGQSAS
jgi:DNA-binding response OmpR family regulator